MMLWEEGQPAAPIALGLADELEAWRSTPYAPGQRRRGVAATCFGFVCGVLDALYGRLTPDELVPHDAQMRTREGAEEAVSRLRGFYVPHEVVESIVVWPGDLVVFGVRGRPSHAALVGPRPREMWETTRGGCVCPMPFEALPTRRERVVGIYRMAQL